MGVKMVALLYLFHYNLPVLLTNLPVDPIMDLKTVDSPYKIQTIVQEAAVSSISTTTTTKVGIIICNSIHGTAIFEPLATTLPHTN